MKPWWALLDACDSTIREHIELQRDAIAEYIPDDTGFSG
jgi:hypothetical protein